MISLAHLRIHINYPPTTLVCSTVARRGRWAWGGRGRVCLVSRCPYLRMSLCLGAPYLLCLPPRVAI